MDTKGQSKIKWRDLRFKVAPTVYYIYIEPPRPRISHLSKS